MVEISDPMGEDGVDDMMRPTRRGIAQPPLSRIP